MVGGLYAALVVLFRLAFTVFTVGSVTGLFLCFAAGLLLGVVGPVIYTVLIRGRALRSLGLRSDRLGPRPERSADERAGGRLSLELAAVGPLVVYSVTSAK